jgi:hypothetical protein
LAGCFFSLRERVLLLLLLLLVAMLVLLWGVLLRLCWGS